MENFMVEIIIAIIAGMISTLLLLLMGGDILVNRFRALIGNVYRRLRNRDSFFGIAKNWHVYRMTESREVITYNVLIKRPWTRDKPICVWRNPRLTEGYTKGYLVRRGSKIALVFDGRADKLPFLIWLHVLTTPRKPTILIGVQSGVLGSDDKYIYSGTCVFSERELDDEVARKIIAKGHTRTILAADCDAVIAETLGEQREASTALTHRATKADEGAEISQ
jgi:hypothetical protein